MYASTIKILNIMSQDSFYPPLSSIISLDALPAQLDVIKDGLNSIFDSLYFRDLRHIPGARGSRDFYSMTLVSYKQVGFFLPGTDIELAFNRIDQPGPTTAIRTEIPLAVNYRWQLMELLRGLSVERLLIGARELLSLLLAGARVDARTVVRDAIDKLAQPSGTLQSFIDEANLQLSGRLHGVQIQLPGDTYFPTIEQKIDNVIAQIEFATGSPVFEALYLLYLVGSQGPDELLKRLDQMFSTALGGASVSDFLLDIIVPKIDGSIRVTPSVIFPRSILVPVDADDIPKPDPERSVLSLGELDFYFSTSRGIGFDTALVASLSRSSIGRTGLIVSFSQVKLDLSTTTSIPEAAADGRGPDFVGVYVGQAEIELPKFWKTKPESERPADANDRARIVASNVLIGTGGFSGTFGLVSTTAEPVLETFFGARDASPTEPGHTGFGIALDRFDIQFHQGAIKHSDIQGMLTIPPLGGNGSPTHVRVRITIDEHRFSVAATLAPTDPPLVIGIPEVFDFSFRGLAIGSQDGRWFLEIAGVLDIIATVPVVGRFITEPVTIDKLVIWSNGEFDVQGGSFVLPKVAPLKLGPVELSVTALHFGRDEQAARKYKFIGFDGGVKTGAGGVDARGEGIKFYFTVDGGTFESFLRIETIRIDLRIPGDATPESAALLLKGYVSMKNPPDDSESSIGEHSPLTEYSGGITFSMPRLKFGGGAEMRMIPSIGAFFVDADIELSTPILLGGTGLGIYGFRGLFGKKYVIQKPESETWWEYFKKPEQGINADKFVPGEGFSIGAGASIGTAVDSGTIFSSKLFFMVTVPTAFFLEGQAAILSQRIGLDTTSDPPFYAVLSVKPDEGIMAGIQTHVKLPQSSGDVLDLDASIEMGFFFGNSSAWYINIGEDAEGKRLRASLLRLFDGWAYFMLASSGIKLGAGVEWSFEQDCGIAKVGLGASLEIGARVNFRPLQLGGWIILQGYAELRVFGIGFRLSVKASLAAEAPHPFIISGSFELSISTPWPLPDIDIDVHLSWHLDDDHDESEIGMIEIPPDTLAGTDPYEHEVKLPVRATHMLTGESFPVNAVCVDSTPGTTPATITDPAGTYIGNGEEFPAPPAPGAASWLDDFYRFVVPIDAYIDIEFSKPVQPRDKFSSMRRIAPLQAGAIYSDLVPPQKGVSDQVRHVYTVDDLTIYYLPEEGGTWTKMEFAEANTPLIDRITTELGGDAAAYQTATEELVSKLKVGIWQLTQADRFTKLRLLARTPLHMSGGTPPTQFGFPESVLRCPPAERAWLCQDWLTSTPRTFDPEATQYDRRLRFIVHDEDPGNGPLGAVVAEPVAPHNYARSIRVQSDQSLEILFPEPVSKVSLLVTTLSQRVVISYYRGYPYTPSPVELSETGRPVDEWSVARGSNGTAATQDDMWDRLRAIPSFTRAFCSGTAPNPSLPQVSSLETIMLKKFIKTSLYLRKSWSMPATPANATFCPRLHDMLEVVVVALTGKDRISRVLKQNVDNFYRDAKRFAQSYVSTLAQSGATIAEPPAAQNAFYEKWLDLIACIGKAYEIRSTLPEAVASILLPIDMEIERLYSRTKDQAAVDGLVLNQPATADDPMTRLKLIAAYFAVTSLTLTSSNIPQLVIDRFDAYYDRLDPLVARLRAAMATRRLGTCAATGASAVPSGDGVSGLPVSSATSCGRLKSLYAIVRLLMAPSAPLSITATEDIIDDITALVEGFEDAINQIEDLFGWTRTSQIGSLADDLPHAVRALAVAWSTIDEIPGALRNQINDFYARLEALVARYATEIEDLDAPQPDPLLDTFVTNWSATLTCLCNLCAEVESLTDASEKSYFLASVDPEIDALYADVVEQTGAAGESVYGSSIPADECTLVQWGIWLMTALTSIDQSTVTPEMQSWLDTELAAFRGSYGDPPQETTRFLQGPVYPYTPAICDGATMDASCANWVNALDCLDQLIRRRAFLPKSIVDQIVADFDQLLMDMASGFMTTYDDYPAWPLVDTAIENVAFSVRFMLGHIYDDCLQGNGVDSSLTFNLDAQDVADLQSRYANLVTALGALPEPIDLCDPSLPTRAERQMTLVETYRRLCNTPPSPSDLASEPLATAMDILHDAADLLDDICAALDLEAIPRDWDQDDFCAIVTRVVRTLVIAYGSIERLPLSLETRMNEMCGEFTDTSATWSLGGPGPLLDTAQVACDAYLGMLLCMSRICRYRDFLPADVFSGTVNSMHERMGSHLIELAKKSLQWGEMLGIETTPDRSTTSRCRKVRAIANYLGASLGSYTLIADAKDAIFDQHESLRTALATGLTNALSRFCPTASDGAYDPLMKRVRLNADQLGTAVTYGAEGDRPIDRIVIAPVGACQGATPCATYLLKVCWLTEEDAAYNDDLPDDSLVLEVNNDFIYCLNKVTQPLWRPNTRYALRMVTTEWIGKIEGKRGYRRAHFFGFRTAGPLGHFHEEGPEASPTYVHPRYQQLLDQKKEESFQYVGLKQYIDYERSYPNADGNIVGAKPLYYEGSKFLLFYTKDYMSSMFGEWASYGDGLRDVRSGLKFIVRDPGSAPNAPAIVIPPVWKADVLPPKPVDVRIFDYIMSNAGGDCVSFTPDERIGNTPPARSVDLPFKLALIPSKLYTLTINSVLQIGTDDPLERQVHKFVFQTSRYRNFQEHIGSYLLSDGAQPKKAVYTIDVDPADAAMALAVLTDQRPTDATSARYDLLTTQFGDKLERIVDGALKLGEMERPATTEFAILTTTSGSTTTVLGVLARSPEPFNDPKQPEVNLASTVGASVAGTVVHFAKDVTRVLLTRADLTYPTGSVDITFTYKLFNGITYAEARMMRPTEADPAVWEEVTVAPITVTIDIA